MRDCLLHVDYHYLSEECWDHWFDFFIVLSKAGKDHAEIRSIYLREYEQELLMRYLREVTEM